MNAGGFIILRRMTLLAAMALFCSPQSFAAGEIKDAKPEEKDVPFLRIGVGDYRNYLKNWDEKKNAVLCALIRTPVQYDSVFHPVPIKNDNRPVAPPETIYEKEQLLVVAHVIAHEPGKSKDNVFDSVWLSEKGDELELHYRYKAPKSETSYKIKTHLTIRIPRRDYRKVTVFENEKQVGELKPQEGLWSVPPMAPPPKM